MIPKKSYGQNFLTSPAARAAIVSAGGIVKDEDVLEIGPGKGFLTEGLLDAGAKVLAIELDNELIDTLENKFDTEIKGGQLKIVNADALKIDTINTDTLKIDTRNKTGDRTEDRCELPMHYKLIANIPYYITGAIIEKYLSAKNKPTSMVILVQREVAERVVARDSKESILSVAVKIYGTPTIVHRVSAGSFFPKPKVDSAVLKISNINNDYFDSFSDPIIAERGFFDLLHAAFAHKRKYMISNIIHPSPHKENILEIFKILGLDEKCRAEDVSVDKWRELYRLVNTEIKK